jgi:DNA-binding transcriptional LysR family regulator
MTPRSGLITCVDWTKLEVRHLQALRAVAREGSFGRAALELGYTQSAISQQIAALERIVGQQLVRRPKGRSPVTLTEAGLIVLRHAEEIVAQAQAARADLDALRRGGTLRVGSFQSTSASLIPGALSALAERVPGAKTEVHEGQGDEELLRLVEAGDLDLAFCVLPAVAGPFVTLELLVDPFALVVSADHPLAAKSAVEAGDLHGLDVVCFHHCRHEHRVEAHLLGRGIVPNFVTRLDDNGALQAMAVAGVGAALMPRMTVDASDSRVRALDVRHLVPDRVVGIAWHRDRALGPAALAFVEAVRRTAAPPRRRLSVVEDARLSVFLAAQFLATGSQPFANLLAG